MQPQEYIQMMKQAIGHQDHVQAIEVMARASQEKNPLLLQALAAIRARPLTVA